MFLKIPTRLYNSTMHSRVFYFFNNREFKKWPNNGTAAVAHFDKQFFDEVCQMTMWNFHIWGSENNNSQQQWIFNLCLNIKTTGAKQAKVHFAYFVQHD